MKTIDLAEVSALTPHLQAGADPLILVQNGHTVAAVIPANDDDVESMLLSVNPKFQEILERSQRRLESEGRVSSTDVRARLNLPGGN